MSNTPSVLEGAAGRLVGCLLVVTPLISANPTVELRLVVAVLALTALLLVGLERLGGGLRLPAPLWPPLLMVAVLGLQLIALPIDWMGVLSPHAAGIWEDVPGIRAAPLSIDPPATEGWGVVHAAFAAVMLAVFGLSRTGHARVLRTLAAAGALVAAASLAHQLGGGRPGWPLPDAATLSGLLVLGGLVATGLAAHAPDGWERLQALVVMGLCFGGVWLAGTTGGAIAQVMGVLIFTGLAHAGSRARHAHLVAYAALLMAATGAALTTLGSELTSPLPPPAPGQHAEYLAQYWRTGCGGGCAGLLGQVPEAYVSQLAIEGGLPALVLLLGGALWALRWVGVGLVEAGRPIDWALVAGLVAVGLQQLVAGGPGSIGLALALAACLGVVCARGQVRHLPAGRTPLTALAVATLALVGLIWLGLRGPTLPGRQIEVAYASADSVVVAEHPADAYLPFVVATRMAKTGAPAEAVEKVRALVRVRTERNPEQAMHAYRRARALAPDLDPDLDPEQGPEGADPPGPEGADSPAPASADPSEPVEIAADSSPSRGQQRAHGPAVSPPPQAPLERHKVGSGRKYEAPIQAIEVDPLGPQSQVRVVQAMERRRGAINACFKDADRLGFTGKLRVQTTVDHRGHVVDTTVIEDTLDEPAIWVCVARTIRRVRVQPPPEAPTTVALSFVLTPSDQAK